MIPLESLTFSPQLFRIVGRISHVVAVRHKATAHLQVLHVKRSVAIRSGKLLVEPAYGIVLRHERVSMQTIDHGLRLIGIQIRIAYDNAVHILHICNILIAAFRGIIGISGFLNGRPLFVSSFGIESARIFDEFDFLISFVNHALPVIGPGFLIIRRRNLTRTFGFVQYRFLRFSDITLRFPLFDPFAQRPADPFSDDDSDVAESEDAPVASPLIEHPAKSIDNATARTQVLQNDIQEVTIFTPVLMCHNECSTA
jgi:hypothetical protein